MSQAPSPPRHGRPPTYWPDVSADLFAQPSVPAPEQRPAHHAEDEFFARGDEAGTFPPSSFDAPETNADEPPPPPPSPQQLRRRARLRRFVAGVVGAASLAMMVVGARAFLTRSRARRPADSSFSVRQRVVPSIDATMAPPSAPAAQLALDPAPTPSDRVRPAHDPAPRTGTKADVRRLLDRGHMREAVAAAREALEADPSDAETYLLLGAALQETGQWRESAAVFARCVDEAKRGPKNECRALRNR